MRLSRNVAAAMLNAGAVMGTAVIAVPLILDRVGTAGFAAWTLVGAVIAYASILETAVGPSLQREVAVSLGAEDPDQIHRTFWTLVLVYAILGAAAVGGLWVIGPKLVAILDLQEPLGREATSAYARVGVPLALVLFASGLANFLQGLGRFAPVAMSAATGGLIYLGSIVVLVGDGQLTNLVWAAALQQASICALRLGALWKVWTAAKVPRVLAKRDLRRVLGFSARLQPTALSELFNWQSDKVVVGAVSSTTTLAHLGIGMQISDAGRIISGAAMNPVIASLTRLAGAGRTAELEDRFRELQRLWTIGLFGGAIIMAASAYPIVVAWVGRENGEAGAFAAILLLGSACWLSAGMGIAYLRAVGRVGLEARYALTVLAANVVLTVVMALTVGAYGVVLGTLGAYAFGAVGFFRRLRHEIDVVPLRSPSEAGRIAAAALACAATSCAWGVAMAGLLPQGVALVPIGAGILAAGLVYGRVAVGLRPRRAPVRTWLPA